MNYSLIYVKMNAAEDQYWRTSYILPCDHERVIATVKAAWRDHQQHWALLDVREMGEAPEHIMNSQAWAFGIANTVLCWRANMQEEI